MDVKYEHVDLVDKYEAFFRELVRIYGKERLIAILKGDRSALYEEVPGND